VRRRRIGRNHRDEDRNDSLVVHPEGEQPEVEAWSAVADTYAGRVHVEWDATAPVTPFGQLPFFIEYLKQGGLFDGWVADCPLSLTSPNAPRKRSAWHRAAVGSGGLSALRPHHGAARRSGEPPARRLEEALLRYQLMEEEYRAWERAFEQYGVPGLRSTRLQRE
jgi:hypothetical protein